MTDNLLFLKSDRIRSNKDVLLQIEHLMTIANLNGLRNEDVEIILDVLLKKTIDDISTFEKLLLCMIPKDPVSLEIVDKIMLWIISFYRSADEKRVSYLIDWIANLLDFNLVNKELVNRYYNFIVAMIEYFPKPICHILYILTEPDDVQAWRILKCSKIIERLGEEGYLIALMSLFKKYKPNLVKSNITPRVNFTPFAYTTKFYKNLRSSLRNIADRNLVDYSDERKVTFSSHPKKIELMWFPAIGYTDISSDVGLDSFDKPFEVLHMLQSATGIKSLTFGDHSLKRRFYYKLYAALEQGFITKRNDISDIERQDLLIKIIQLHRFCLQGLKPVSDFISEYLKYWNGRDFKVYIYELIEWFICSDQQKLNRNLLWPLYMLFITSKPTEMCEILSCLTSLIMNLYIVVERRRNNTIPLFPDDTFDDADGLDLIIRSLSEYFKRLLKLGLINFPFDCSLLCVGITFYERMFYIERRYKTSYCTIIPPVLIYESMFSCTAIHINRICGLLLKYDDAVKNSTVSCTKDLALLNFYHNDIYNGFWAQRILQKREDGCMFYNLSAKVVNKVLSMTDFDSAFDIRSHVMFHPYRRHLTTTTAYETKEQLVSALKSATPHLVDLISYLDNNFNDSVEESGTDTDTDISSLNNSSHRD